MRAFADLYTAIDETNRTTGKVKAMVEYFQSVPAEDAAWAVNFLIGRRPKRLIQTGKLYTWAAEMAGLPDWLFAECYDAVGDLAETIALILPESEASQTTDDPLSVWVTERLLPISQMSDDEQKATLFHAWRILDRQERFVWNKLITGAFRVGVSSDLVVRALSQATNIPAPVISHRLMGDWKPSAEFFQGLFDTGTEDADVSRPYPFCLAHPLEGEVVGLGEIEEWHAEWKWDGIRAQVIRRKGQSFIWSRGEDLITERFPEVLAIADVLPDGTVLDGEILAWDGQKPMKFAELQKRIGRKVLGKRILQDVPAVLVAFDLLEFDGRDVRSEPFSERRQLLDQIVHVVTMTQTNLVESPGKESPTLLRARGTDAANPSPEGGAGVGSNFLARNTALRNFSVPNTQQPTPNTSSPNNSLLLSQRVKASSWQELADLRETARSQNVEGLMLKRLDSPYVVGRKKGVWWKWKIDPLTVDAVLIYAQRGSGKRASLYTDYTFGVWSEGKLVPFAKAYSGLTDDEIRRVDTFVRRYTLEKFGPVRTVKPELVMELAFEGIQLSTRHKSGIAVRFPRIQRWRQDKKPEDADSLESVKDLLKIVE